MAWRVNLHDSRSGRMLVQLHKPRTVEIHLSGENASMEDCSWLEINMTRLDHNLAAFRRMTAADHPAKKPLICGAVKADAYGLGAVQIAQRLALRRVDMVAVYSPQQANELVRRNINLPIMILMPISSITRSDPIYRPAVAGRLHITLHELRQIDALNQCSQMLGMKTPIHVHHDTGMSRSGLNDEDAASALWRLHECRYLRTAGVYTHLASAGTDEDMARKQLEHFNKFCDANARLIPDDAIKHVANTFGTLRDRDFHLDLVRIGLGLYGFGPDLLEGGSALSEAEELQPIVRWVSRINHVQRLQRGATVGYDATHKLRRHSVLGVIPVGYGDGYPLALSNKGVVLLPDVRGDDNKPVQAQVLGRINMDQIVIDLTDAARIIEKQPDPNAAAAATLDPLAYFRGREVELMSQDPTSPCSVPRMAAAAGSSTYEILSRLSANLTRKYVAAEA